MSLDVPWCETWYVNLFSFIFDKIKVLEWPMSRKWVFGLYAYKFELVPRCKHDMWTYLVLYSVKWKYWNDPCPENEILVYMPTRLINGKFELVPWCETWHVKLFGFEFGKMKVLEWLCRESIWFCIR